MNPANEPANAQVRYEQFVVFVLDSEEYAVPILTVTEVVPSIEITPVPGAPEYILGLTNLRGKILPVLDLEKKFDLNHQSQSVRKHIMFAESEQKALFGILVDQVKEVLKVPADTITPTPQVVKSRISSEYLGGVIVLGGGGGQGPSEERMLLILDLQKILSGRNIEELQAAQNTSPQAAVNEGGA